VKMFGCFSEFSDRASIKLKPTIGFRRFLIPRPRKDDRAEIIQNGAVPGQRHEQQT